MSKNTASEMVESSAIPTNATAHVAGDMPPPRIKDPTHGQRADEAGDVTKHRVYREGGAPVRPDRR